MTLQLGCPVVYRVLEEHKFLYGQPLLAAIVTRVREDGAADLVVFPPNADPTSVAKVTEGTEFGQAVPVLAPA